MLKWGGLTTELSSVSIELKTPFICLALVVFEQHAAVVFVHEAPASAQLSPQGHPALRPDSVSQ